MRTVRLAFGLSLTALAAASGCAARGPLFAPVTAIPPQHGLVYIYSVTGSSSGNNVITDNNQKIASLGPEQYLVHFALQGQNVYSFRVNSINVLSLLVNYGTPSPTVLQVEPGQTYYLKVTGAGQQTGFWRVDSLTALQELPNCHLVQND
jgi:hypothetical protein